MGVAVRLLRSIRAYCVLCFVPLLTCVCVAQGAHTEYNTLHSKVFWNLIRLLFGAQPLRRPQAPAKPFPKLMASQYMAEMLGG